MTSINAMKAPRQSLEQQDSQNPADLARTLRRIKRRLLLQQCGVSLPYALQSTPQVLIRPLQQCGVSLPYALQSTPQVLIRPSSRGTTGCHFEVGMSKSRSSLGRAPVESQVALASPSTE